MPEHTDIGATLAELRKRRGMTQQQLSRSAGVSLSTVRKTEQGETETMRMETARRFATALRVPTTALLARDEAPAHAGTVDHWAPVRAALAAPPQAQPQEPPTTEGVREALQAAEPLFSGDRFADLAALLPQLLRDADALDGDDPGARAVRVRLLQLTGWLLTQTRQYEAAEMALDRAEADANDRFSCAASVNTRCWLLLRTGRLTKARELATRWADDTEPRLSKATPEELSTWGWMLLRVSAAAVRDNRSGEAADALRMARAAAVALGREHAPHADFLRTFGPTTVVLKRAENASVTDQPDVVLRVAATVPKGGLRPTSNNRNRHLLDVANAHTSMRQYGDAVETLQKIRENSPEWLPQQRFAQDIMGRIIDSRRTLTAEMRELADAISPAA
ncbi:helix-turn-helix domain-containing protein [Streptomyces nanshensis]|uniref:DNA-binding protein n=1 Tax=Streptomyces nanshensis TaxID=518642 RepID=A0A1E7LCH5_9ACTN|nr:helix-turn-helix transcriptional regulator [Streptomyces nanshensis]OEV13907.1 DNA-binding protein [Streptomyces nanshensis]